MARFFCILTVKMIIVLYVIIESFTSCSSSLNKPTNVFPYKNNPFPKRKIKPFLLDEIYLRDFEYEIKYLRFL